MPDMLSLRVVIAGKDAPIPVTLPAQASVQSLTDAVFQAEGPSLQPATHRLRFIVAGKNLSPNIPTLQDAGLKDGSFVHCAVSETRPGDYNAINRPGDQNLLLDRHDEGMVTIDLGRRGEHANFDVLEASGHFFDDDDGTFQDWCWGFLLGVLLGLIMMVLAMDRSIALSRKWKRGITYGTAVNILFGLALFMCDGYQ